MCDFFVAPQTVHSAISNISNEFYDVCCFYMASGCNNVYVNERIL